MGKHQDASESSDGSVFRIHPYHYLHVLDKTTNVTRVEVGPQTFIRKENEKVVLEPTKMVIVPPLHYCIVKNPIKKDDKGEPVKDALNQVVLQHGEEDVRLHAQEPFPLYPGEELDTNITALERVPALAALRLLVLRDFTDEVAKVERRVGEEYMFKGPGIFIPRKEVKNTGLQKAVIVLENTALHLRAEQETIDSDGNQRVAGEEWLVRKTGAYLPGVYEKILGSIKACILTDKTAVHVKAVTSFRDQLGKARKNGEEYLVTFEHMETFIPDVHEQVIKVVQVTSLTSRQYCIVLNPVGDDGKPQLGHAKLVQGEKSFFLLPGEELENGIQDVYVLGDDEGLVLRALEEYQDDSVTPSVKRLPGDKWMLRGPMDYVPPLNVEVVASRKAIPLHDHEGVYVRNNKTGAVRAVIGQTYMLGEDEELWEKSMSDVIKSLLDKNRDVTADRAEYVNSRTRTSGKSNDVGQNCQVVTFQVPSNAAVQIYDYKSKKSRVIFGPDLVMLEPNEEFTQLSLSGGKPKKPNLIRSLALLLGPDFCSDIVNVETADHARLRLELSYNWHFDIKNKDDPKEAARLFCIPDFIGDMCKAIASRVRGAVSAVSFDNFHKHSAKIITTAVFGVDETGKSPQEELRFLANNLVVTSIDVKSVEPVDQRTRDSLQKSVTLAIEITTQSQEAAAKREAERVDQEAKGRLERQKILDEAEAEKARKALLTLQGESAAVESTGQAKAEATSRAEAAKIEAEAAVEAAKLKAEAMRIEAESDLERLRAAREAEIQFLMDQNRLEVEKAERMAQIQSNQFKAMVDSIGADTIKAIASGPQDHQVSMLKALGLQTTLITDGKNPVNLFNAAQGLLGGSNLNVTNSS